MPRKGRSLEKLVTHLERVLAPEEGVTVDSPKRLRDKTTGRLREHDVVLTFRAGHHELLTAIECRDRKRRVGSPQIEAFHKKCEHTGVHHPIMVSPRGFTKPALQKAKFLGVRCLALEQAPEFDWLLAPGLRVCKRRLTSICCTLDVTGHPLEAEGDYALVDEAGADVPHSDVERYARTEFVHRPWDLHGPTERTDTFDLEPGGLQVKGVGS